MLLAVDASLLTEGAAGRSPSRALHQAHRWLSLTLVRPRPGGAGRRARAARRSTSPPRCPTSATSGGMLLLSRPAARRAGPDRCAAAATPTAARELAAEAIARRRRRPRAGLGARAGRADLLDVVQAWALTCADDLDGALRPAAPGPPARRRPRAALWLRGYTDLALARLLARLAERDDDADDAARRPIGLLVDAAGAFAAAGDRRRYRQCLLELGQHRADLGRPAEALHWLEAYRADTGRAHARGREMWAEMFVRRSRLREAERQAALLRRHALEDPLTGLGNRRSAERRLGALRLGEEPLSLAVVDVDRFKEVNDERLAHRTATPSSAGSPTCCASTAAPATRSTAGPATSSWSCCPTATEAQAVVVMERLRARRRRRRLDRPAGHASR